MRLKLESHPIHTLHYAHLDMYTSQIATDIKSEIIDVKIEIKSEIREVKRDIKSLESKLDCLLEKERALQATAERVIKGMDNLERNHRRY